VPSAFHLFFLFWPEKRKVLCSEVQKILADDLPYLPLWFTDVVSVHRRSLGDLPALPRGDFDFLAMLSALR
jgi:ABC-type transport system substrate-binding protein